MSVDPVVQEVRRVLAEHGRLSTDLDTLTDDADLYRAGLTSHASVTVMLACEDAFDVEFTGDMLTKATFSSVGSIARALQSLGASAGSVVP